MCIYTGSNADKLIEIISRIKVSVYMTTYTVNRQIQSIRSQFVCTTQISQKKKIERKEQRKK